MTIISSSCGNNLASDSNNGDKTNWMKPSCAVALVTLVGSMNGATGRPSLLSLSAWRKKLQFGWGVSITNQMDFVTWAKYSSSRHSTHGPETSIGLTSLDMSQALMSTCFKLLTCCSFSKLNWSTTVRKVSKMTPCRAISVARISSMIPFARKFK